MASVCSKANSLQTARKTMKKLSAILWIFLAALFAVSFAIVTHLVNPAEKVNALWIVTAAASFYISAVYDTNITGPKATLISAQGLDNVGNPVGTAATQILTVQDIDGPSLQVLIANKVVPKGTTAATTAASSARSPCVRESVVTRRS